MNAPRPNRAESALGFGERRLAKVDTESEPELGARHGIRSIPTLALFRGGREVTRQAGAMGVQDIVRWVRAHA